MKIEFDEVERGLLIEALELLHDHLDDMHKEAETEDEAMHLAEKLGDLDVLTNRLMEVS